MSGLYWPKEVLFEYDLSGGNKFQTNERQPDEYKTQLLVLL